MDWISGRVIVHGSDEGISGVAVSDGVRFVSTDATGAFKFQTTCEQQFVFISIPAGFKITSDEYNRAIFYKEKNQEMIFELERELEQDTYSFLLITDLHLGRGKGLSRFKDEVIPEINHFQPAFTVAMGDIAFQEGVIGEYVELMKDFQMPVFNTVGNHEMMMHRIDPKKDYKQLFGPTYYSFNYGSYHFVDLDGCVAAPYREGWKNVVGFIDKAQLSWLKQDLDFLQPGTPVIVFIHIPIVSSFTERRGLGPKDEPSWEIINDKEIINILAQYNVKYVFQGHMHDNEHIHEQGIHFVESASISGSWWDGCNVDGTPEGYRTIRINGMDCSMVYHALGSGKVNPIMSIEQPIPQQIAKDPELPIAVNVFDGDPVNTKVVCTLSDSVEIRLEPTPSTKHAHFWKGSLSIADFPKGPHTLKVMVTSPEINRDESISISIV